MPKGKDEKERKERGGEGKRKETACAALLLFFNFLVFVA
jgi:hypothetical protein